MLERFFASSLDLGRACCLSFGLLIAGCFLNIDPALEGYPCDPDDTCHHDLVCIDGICVSDPCIEMQCGQQEVCTLGVCGPIGCENGWCPTGLVCIDGACVPDPCIEMQCGQEEVCTLGVCHPIRCEDGLCPTGLICVDEVCVTLTCAHITCEPGELCAVDRCYPTDCDGVHCGTGVCVNGECVPHSCVGVTCPEGEGCALGECYPRDCGTTECGPTEVCIGGECVDVFCAGVKCDDGLVCDKGECVAPPGCEPGFGEHPSHVGECHDTIEVPCDPSDVVVPEHATFNDDELVTISWIDDHGWSDPAACGWTCHDGFSGIAGKCLASPRLAGGQYFCVALDHEGHPWAWGNNDRGQLGIGSQSARWLPARVDTQRMSAPIRTLAAGNYHALALDEDGRLWAWGNNAGGQLGDGTLDHRSYPAAVDMSVIGRPVGLLAAGDRQSFAIDEDGTLWAWGANEVGETGTGSGQPAILRPTRVDTSEMTGAVQAIAAGHHHALVITMDGALWSFGLNSKGQLGIGSHADQYTPVAVDTSAMKMPVRSVGAGAHFSIAVDDDGDVWVFGGTEPFVGESSDLPVRLDGDIRGGSGAAGGASHIVVLSEDGRAHSAGSGWAGQLGHGSPGDSLQFVTVDMFEMTAPLVELVSGQHTSHVRDTEGKTWGWGGGVNVGDGFNSMRPAPVTVVAIRERLEARELLSQANLAGDFETVGSDPEALDGSWLTAVDPGTDTHLHVRLRMPDLEAPTTRWQRARALVRPSAGGTGTPSVRVQLLVAGSVIAERNLPDLADAVVVVLRWDATSVAAQALENVEMRVDGFSSNGAEPRTVEIGAIVWEHLVPWPDRSD